MEQQHHHFHHQQPPQFTVSATDVHPVSAANPTPTHPQLSASHPSYAEMITAAIIWDSSQGKAGGSSKRAIAKYIDRVYSNLPPTHSALLTHHLKRLKSTGQLVMIKNSYQLPIVAAAAANAAVPLRSAPPQPQPSDVAGSTPKRKPGRPPKAKSPGQPIITTISTASGLGNGPSSGKRPRGRPPRNQQPAVSEVPFVQTQPQPEPGPVYADVELNNGSPPAAKKRGRPFKNKPQQPASVPAPVAQESVQKKRPGRPSKAKANVAAVPTGGSGRPRGRPRRNALAPVAMPIGKKPRGRPPRQGVVAIVPGSGAVGVKRRGRGRPAKGSVPLARKYAGKPRGRPRKNASTVEKQTSDQLAFSEDLMKKIENMQATIRNAVGVLRPCVANESTGDALAALQELENLSTVNVTASPPPDESQMIAMSVSATAQVQPSTSVPAPESIPAPPLSTYAVPMMVPPVVPFSIAAPTMTETAPLYAPPSTIEAQQTGSWIPSSEAQL